MARSDLLISLVKAGKQSPDPRFRATVEAIIAEERAKHHSALADQLTAAMHNGVAHAPTATLAVTAIGDLLYEIQPQKSLDEMVLSHRVRTECDQLLEEHRRGELLRSYGLSPRHRLLLVGPPGNGKTSLAQAIAHDLLVPLLVVRYEGLIGSFLGETASRLRRIFDFARQRACVLFLDEFDTIGKERGDTHETGEIKRVVSTLLLQMDQLPSHVVIVTATNHPELLDRAVWRRFEIRLELARPSVDEIDRFLDQLCEGFPLARGWDTRSLARQLRGSTYSDVEDLFRNISRCAVLQSPEPDLGRIVKECMDAWRGRVTSNTTRKRTGKT